MPCRVLRLRTPSEMRDRGATRERYLLFNRRRAACGADLGAPRVSRLAGRVWRAGRSVLCAVHARNVTRVGVSVNQSKSAHKATHGQREKSQTSSEPEATHPSVWCAWHIHHTYTYEHMHMPSIRIRHIDSTARVWHAPPYIKDLSLYNICIYNCDIIITK